MLVEAIAALGAAAIPAGVYVHVSRLVKKVAQATVDNSVVITRAPPEKTRNPRVLAIMLGWGGATLKQMRRQTQWYIQNGVTTVTYIPPMIDLVHGYVDIRPLEKICEYTIEEIGEHKDPQVYLHVHSNNGMFAYGALLNIWSLDEYSFVETAIKGVVFDSCPNLERYIKSAAPMAFPLTAMILNRPQYFHWLYTPALLFVLPIMRMQARRPPHGIPKMECVQMCYDDYLENIPQLYLHSDADKLIPSSVVKKYIQLQSEHGKTVSEHVFKGSPHVGHFRMFPEEYTKQLIGFMRLDGATPLTKSDVRKEGTNGDEEKPKEGA
eukprot:comp20429_c0_seq1/m.25941 comp20429_c0_seq1/g.25941  ORF comp20429_c0_seq1/g.25941 comp20429_c0_seq1/m.25941 type:complete len:323 (-) comp20429_c0_seq1:533-1501(-)